MVIYLFILNGRIKFTYGTLSFRNNDKSTIFLRVESIEESKYAQIRSK